MKKKVTCFILAGFIFVYGFAIGYYKIFPFNQFIAIKNLITDRAAYFTSDQETQIPQSVDIMDTFLQRLFVKKIDLGNFGGYGGGVSSVDDILYIVSNKGTIRTFNTGIHERIPNEITPPPLNLEGLYRSGHHEKNDFRMIWFRVNGVYTEKSENGNHVLFMSHNSYDQENDCITHNVSRINLELESSIIRQLDNWETIFTARPCIDPEPENFLAGYPYSGHISGGSIIHFNDENLLITVGDYNHHGLNGVPRYAMETDNPYGKYILLNKETGEWTAYAIGSRNPSGLYMDQNSTIWAVENGPESGDELNIIHEGSNFGWPEVSYGLWYNPEFELSEYYQSGRHSDYDKPIYAWMPSVAPSSIVKLDGDEERFSYWKNDLLIGTMRDRSILRLRLDQMNRVVYSERIDIGHRVRDIETLENGIIVVLTDDEKLIIMDDGGPSFKEMDSFVLGRMVQLDRFDNLLSGDDSIHGSGRIVNATYIYDQNCSNCHNLNQINQIGPHLNNLIGRVIGSVEGFNYSQTLSSDNRVWNENLLASFLMNPDEEFSGNRMPKINLSQAEIDSLINYFSDQNQK